MRVGLIGCGAIGTTIAKAVESDERIRLEAVYDLEFQKALRMVQNLEQKVEAVENFEDLISLHLDVVVEAASQHAVEQYGESILQTGKDLMVMSVGAFVDEGLLERITKTAEENRRRLIIPSGAVSGIDTIKTVSRLIDEITLTTTKHPESLRGASFFQKKGINPEGIKEECVLFEGSAREAVRLFPENVNVAAVISLAGAGWDKTKVKIVADPAVDRNIHQVKASGEFGEVVTLSRNVKSPNNPRTSYLAALSAIKTLKNMENSIVIGT